MIFATIRSLSLAALEIGSQLSLGLCTITDLIGGLRQSAVAMPVSLLIAATVRTVEDLMRWRHHQQFASVQILRPA
jgi:hypothetical protein